ncbi:hypothetical protein [Actinotalea sp. Marseille-Q4924]|nr:hypothetical protein [Actinotalea sp. Marseille-Q4924]
MSWIQPPDEVGPAAAAAAAAAAYRSLDPALRDALTVGRPIADPSGA